MVKLEALLEDMPALRDFLARFRPLNGVVVLLRDPVEQVTRGGIIIPKAYQDDSKEKKHPAFKATVLKLGPGPWATDGKKRIEPLIAPGDRVLVGRWGANEMKHVKDLGIRNVFTMQYLDVIGILDE